MTWTFSAFADEAGSDLDTQIDALKSAGLKYIDPRNVGRWSIVELPQDDAKQMRSQLDAAGITVGMFGSPIGKLDIADDFAIDLQRLDHLGKLADIFDCRAVRIFSYYNKDEKSVVQWQSVTLDRLSQLRDRAIELGLTLYHENERGIFGDSVDHVLAMTEALYDPDSFRFIFDFDNYNQSGEDCWVNWQKLRDRTGAIHFKDSTAPPNPMHVPLGEGNGKARQILADAWERGWCGPVVLEPHLTHSDAVLATGPSGTANQTLAELTPVESFQLAAETAKQLLDDLGIDYQ